MLDETTQARAVMSPGSPLIVDPVLIRKYDVAGPRYTSYPTADRFSDAFGEAQYRAKLEERFLRRDLGDEAYASYRRRVPMLIPFAKVAPPASNEQGGGG